VRHYALHDEEYKKIIKENNKKEIDNMPDYLKQKHINIKPFLNQEVSNLDLEERPFANFNTLSYNK